MAREVPRRLTPSPEERLRNIVSTVAPGSDQGSTLFARKVADSNLAAMRVVPNPSTAVYIQPGEPQGVAPRTFWLDTDAIPPTA